MRTRERTGAFRRLLAVGWAVCWAAAVLGLSACSQTSSDPLLTPPAVIDEASPSAESQTPESTAGGDSVEGSQSDQAQLPPSGDENDDEAGAVDGETGDAETPIPITGSAPDGSFVILDEGVVPLVDNVVPRYEAATGPAYADGSGGLVFQPPWAVDGAVFHAGGEDGIARPLLNVEGERELRLWGATSAGGAPRLLATVIDVVEGVRTQTVFWWDSASKVQWVASVTDSEVRAVDHGVSRFVLDVVADGQERFVFWAADGTADELATNPKPACSSATECPTFPSLSPDGGMLAYYDPAIDSVVVTELDLAEEVAVIAIPSESVVTSLDLSGTDLVINHSVGELRQAALVVDLTDDRPRPEQLPVPGDTFLG